MAQALHDENRITTLLGTSNADGVTPVVIWADPATHRLLVDLPAGSGTVTSVSVVSANGLAGSVANATTTPVITLSCPVTGILKSDGTTISACSNLSDVVYATGTGTADGTNTGDQTNISGNAATATKLAATKMINGVAFDGSADIDNVFPEGVLVNGIIVPSVASGNLTVALKYIDSAGNISDPSATKPVKIRIGGVVRSITGALSVVRNAATGWCNSGSAELATKEIDYPTFLSYNATDGVVLAFSRYFGSIYSDFSATTTNEKYVACSGTNMAAGDPFVVIGRFAATLSAGAGYTWSVPTFTASNLIQKPIYETRLLSWIPNLTTGNAHLSAYSLASYQITNNSLRFYFSASGNLSGTAGSIKVTLPFTGSSLDNTLIGTCYDSANQIANLVIVRESARLVEFYKSVSAANWAASEAGIEIKQDFTYPI